MVELSARISVFRDCRPAFTSRGSAAEGSHLCSQNGTIRREMGKKLTKRQLINVELATRARNKRMHKVLDRHIPEEEKAVTKIEFTCECADPDCQVHIPLTLEEYDALHQDFTKFVVAKGHNYPALEKVKLTTRQAAMVEKYELKRLKDLTN